jgi:hypothetical protein
MQLKHLVLEIVLPLEIQSSGQIALKLNRHETLPPHRCRRPIRLSQNVAEKTFVQRPYHRSGQSSGPQ